MIKFKTLADGGFVCGDLKTLRTAYAYPTSSHATIARKMPERVAREMLKGANALGDTDGRYRDYDDRMWMALNG